MNIYRKAIVQKTGLQLIRPSNMFINIWVVTLVLSGEVIAVNSNLISEKTQISKPEITNREVEEEQTSLVGSNNDLSEGIELTDGFGRYSSRGRRDPFVSLSLGFSVLDLTTRPPGLQGMLIQEVSLQGIVKTSEGYIAMFQGTDSKSYFARNGDQLYDGNIANIDGHKVVFQQKISEPFSEGKFQQVEKQLHPLEEQR